MIGIIGMRSSFFANFSKPVGIVGFFALLIMYARPSNRNRNRWMISLLELDQNPKTILEIGSGPGYALKLVCDQRRKLDIYAIDHSARAISFAKLVNPNCNITFQQSSVEAIDSIPGQLDRVYTANSHQFWQNEDNVFKNIFRKLNKNGLLVIVYQPRCRKPSNDTAEAEASRLADLLKSVGFTKIEVKELNLRPVKAIAVVARKESS